MIFVFICIVICIALWFGLAICGPKASSPDAETLSTEAYAARVKQATRPTPEHAQATAEVYNWATEGDFNATHSAIYSHVTNERRRPFSTES